MRPPDKEETIMVEAKGGETKEDEDDNNDGDEHEENTKLMSVEDCGWERSKRNLQGNEILMLTGRERFGSWNSKSEISSGVPRAGIVKNRSWIFFFTEENGER